MRARVDALAGTLEGKLLSAELLSYVDISERGMLEANQAFWRFTDRMHSCADEVDNVDFASLNTAFLEHLHQELCQAQLRQTAILDAKQASCTRKLDIAQKQEEARKDAALAEAFVGARRLQA